MVNLESDIRVLIERYECVVIPGFGGFIGVYKPASVQGTSHLFSPPSKKIAFNIQLREDDGLLINHLSTSRQISYSAARSIVVDWKNELLKELEQKGVVTIDNLGTFQLDADAGLIFEVESDINLLSDSYGLRSFSAEMVVFDKKVTETPSELSQLLVATNQPKRKLHSLLLKYGSAAAVLVLFGFWITFNLIPTHQNRTNVAGSSSLLIEDQAEPLLVDLNSVTEATLPNVKTVNIYTEALTIHTTSEVPSAHTDSDKKVQETPSNQQLSPEEVKPETTELESNLTPEKGVEKPSKPIYYIIGGSFKSKALAEKFAAKYSSYGYETEVIGPSAENGRYRVSLGASERRAEVRQQLNTIRDQEIADAWILKF